MTKKILNNQNRPSFAPYAHQPSCILVAALTCLVTLPAAALTGLWPLAAAAQVRPTGGVALAPEQLSRPHRQELIQAVTRARRQHPEAFSAVAHLRQTLPQRAQAQRGRVVTLVRPLRTIGKQELMALLAELAVQAPGRGSLSERAWQGWQISLLEAVGRQRDRRAVPVLWGILQHNPTDPVLLRSSATALARLNDPKIARQLIQTMGKVDSALRRAILPALGQCRRLVVARELARVLQQAEPGSWEQEVALRALGQVGNVGAWRTPAVKGSGQGDAVRHAALKAVVAAYPWLAQRLQDQAYKAVLLIDHPKTEAILASARQDQSGKAREALDQLAHRVTRAKIRH